MATSVAQICNKALARLGIKNYVDDLDNDQTEEAETCKVFYEDTRDAMLASFPWPFATLRATLAAIPAETEAARVGWAYAFGLPEDCLVARGVWPVTDAEAEAYADLYGPQGRTPLLNAYLRTPRSDQKVPFAIEKASTGDHRILLCDLSTPVLFYTARVKDPTRFPPLFIDALAWLLAAEMALPLTQSDKKEVLCRQRHREKVGLAQAVALSEQHEDQEPDSELIAVRR